MKRDFIAALLVLMALLASLGGCGRNASNEGRDYLEDLVEDIQEADRIVVVEHSAPHEAAGAERVYGRVVLSAEQKHAFRTVMAALDSKTQDAVPACVFSPHHRIEFSARGKLISTMEICFACGQVQWDGSDSLPPWSLAGGLQAFVASVGLRPERDWAALAAGVSPPVAASAAAPQSVQTAR